ncbi:5-methylcytosine rRNA methyltransferase NSUN4 [Diorhabda carinulata]|uniref:5-methylcytosine rRNA methyltransferase NSUN4 n=1 Tax=Diorhabda carinulata TaxID=1163345 RepID=UPI0025A0F7BF|nr:5-methylcytosine rRNA methyltransferase NSUN4 [Diorhabda carinulata]
MYSYSILKYLTRETKILVRYKHPPNHWSVVRKKVHPVDKALNHFDDFYEQVFGKNWLAIRRALLCKNKYVAVLNYYGDIEDTKYNLELKGALNMRVLFDLEKSYIREKTENIDIVEEISETVQEFDNQPKDAIVETQKLQAKDLSLKSSLEKAEYDTRRLVNVQDALSTEILYEFIPTTKIKGKEDFLLESTHYKLYDQNTQFGVNVEKEYDFHFPDHLNIYCFEEGNKSEFPSPKKSITGVYNYYLMDGGSVLPVLALDIKPGNRILDMCAAPGGKSLLALQTLYPSSIVSNDISYSRANRIDNVYKQFLFDFDEKWLQTGKIRLTNYDGRIIEEDTFDRILVDVPCTTDRHSLHENDNNIFKPSRIKERLQLPELQRQLLFQAFKLVKIGGVVVYSTCSLSPIQNDGVVHMALKQAWEETNMEFIVKDLSQALLQTKRVYEYADANILRYGHLIVPSMKQNYGPTYFCKLQKIK